jgi:hypothetical protein
MKSLAGFIMRGPAQAALVAGLTGLVSLLLPLLGLLSSATLALVTLRHGPRYGLVVGGLAGLACLVLCALLLGSPWPTLLIILVLWLPVWGLAAVLRFSRSLSLTTQLAGLVGVSAILLVHALVADPAGYWLALMEPFHAALVKDGVLEGPSAQAVFAELANWMTGAFAAALLFQLLMGLFIGRWWQALLYNPGGFGADFRSFRLHPVFGILGLVLVTLIGFIRGPGLAPDLLLVLSPLWLLQGLAVIHDLHAARRAPVGWLVALYVLLLLLMPHAELMVASLGLVDIWADLRARFRRNPTSSG